MYYKIADLILYSEIELPFYSEFECNEAIAEIRVLKTTDPPTDGIDINAGSMLYRILPNGWFFHPLNCCNTGLYVNKDYSELYLLQNKDDVLSYIGVFRFLRLVIECKLLHRGYLTLHSACIVHNEQAILFTGVSGIGKSTRAQAWMDAFGDDMLSGDRPLINTKTMEVYGAPWDGKEQCFRNKHASIRCICEIRRSNYTYMRHMTLRQKRKLLLNQCMLPMWDSSTAAIQTLNIFKLASYPNITRLFCGPKPEDAVKVEALLRDNCILQEEKDMYAKKGFMLKNIMGENVLMPIGEKVESFHGTIIMNEVAAFIWENLQNPISEADLLRAMLDTYNVDEVRAKEDIHNALYKLKGYGVIELDE